MKNYFSELLNEKMEDGLLGLVISPKDDEENVYHVDTGVRLNGQLATLFYKENLPPFSIVVGNRNLANTLGATENGYIITAKINFVITPAQILELKIDPNLLETMLILRFNKWPGMFDVEGWNQIHHTKQERR